MSRTDVWGIMSRTDCLKTVKQNVQRGDQERRGRGGWREGIFGMGTWAVKAACCVRRDEDETGYENWGGCLRDRERGGVGRG